MTDLRAALAQWLSNGTVDGDLFLNDAVYHGVIEMHRLAASATDEPIHALQHDGTYGPVGGTITVESLAKALPDWMVEHPMGRSENELRLIIAENIIGNMRTGGEK